MRWFVAAAATAIAVAADFVHLVQDSGGVWWLEHNGARFMSLGINHVNNGGMDDGVGGRESVLCQADGARYHRSFVM